MLEYADDTTAVLSDEESAHEFFNLLEIFRKVSGLKLNISKTEGLWIGSNLKDKGSKPQGSKWPSAPIKALGVFFTYDRKLFNQKIFLTI